MSYADQVAAYRAARPDLEGYGPCCGHCVHISRDTIGSSGECAVDGVVRLTQSECGNEGFTYDARPLWEQFPWISEREWKADGMAFATDRAIKDHVASGGSVDDLMTLRVGGKRLVFPPTHGHQLPDAAFSEDPYGLLPDAQSVKGKLDALQAEREAKAKGAA